MALKTSAHVSNDCCLTTDRESYLNIAPSPYSAMTPFSALAEIVVTLFNPIASTIQSKRPIFLYLIAQSLITTLATYDGWTLVEHPSWEWPRMPNTRIGVSILTQTIVLIDDRTLLTFNYTHDILTNHGTFYLSSAFSDPSSQIHFAQVRNILYMLGGEDDTLNVHRMHTINVDTLETQEDVGLYLDADTICLTPAQNRYIIQTGGLGYNKLRIYDTLDYSVRIDGPNMLQTRMFHTCIVVHDRLFLIGGSTVAVEYIDVSDINAIGSESWVHFADLFERRSDAVSMQFGNDIMVVSGYYVANWSNPVTEYRNSVEIINTLTGSVSIEGYIPLPVQWAVGIAINDTAYLIGGATDAGYVYGYQTVYTGDTKPPTTDPTSGPTRDPSNNPSQSPTAAPSNAPSTTPSDSPSRAPTTAPSTPPTNAPTYTPSRAPSNTPSTPPSQAPSAPPTRYPTTHNAHPQQLIVEFSLSDIARIVNSDDIKGMTIILQNVYVIVSGLFEELELGDQLQYREFQVLMDGTTDHSDYNLTMRLDSFYSVKYDTDDIGDSIRFISRQEKFGSEVTQKLKTTFGGNITFSVHEVYLEQTEESVDEAFDYVFPSLAAVMSVSVLMALGAFVFNKKDTKIDDAAWTAVIMFGLQVFDLGSDVNLCVEILLQFKSMFKLSLLYISGYGTLFFIIIPYTTNLVLASKMKEIVAGNSAAVAYFEQRSALFVSLVLLSGGAYPVLALMSSRIFGLDIFNCGLTRYELMRLSKLKIFGTVVIENLPQMCFQLLYISYSGVPSQNTILSSIASFLSIVGACLSYCIQKQGGDCFVNQYDLQFKKANHQSLTQSENTQILAKKECKKALRYVLSAALDVIETQMELGFVNMSQSGFVVHIVHYTSKQQLDNFNDGAILDGDAYGGENQLYHHLVAVFTERLYTVRSDKVNQAFHTHFGFNKNQFKVKYHKHFGYNSLLYTSMGDVMGETKHSKMIELASSTARDHDEKANDAEHVQTMCNLAETISTALNSIQIDDAERDALYTQLAEQTDKEVMDHIFAIWRVKISNGNDGKIMSNGESESDEVKDKEEEVPALAVPERNETVTNVQSYSTENEGDAQTTTGQKAKGEETSHSEQDDLDEAELDALVAIAIEFDQATDNVTD